MVMEHPTSVRSGSWADPDYIAEKYKYNPETDIWLGRNPHNFDDQIGYGADDRHVFVCAGSGGGKGRSVVINNLLNWRGSIVSIDPKGENASVCAARRANGDEHCKGLGQKTYVLDPFGLAKNIPPELRASCNLMDALDESSGDLLDQAAVLADGLRISKGGGESDDWSKEGAEITALIIAHVKSDKTQNDNCRDLIYVRELVCMGLQSGVPAAKRRNQERIKAAKKSGKNEEPELEPILTPFEYLFMAMLDNPAQGGAIKMRAQSKLDLLRNNVRQWGSLIHNASSETAFLDSLPMHDQLIANPDNPRTLDISALKSDPDGVSVFICLPDNSRHPAVRWQKALIALILDRMKLDQRKPATGKQVLMVIDEFASMGKMDDVIHGMTSIRGAGVKLFVIVTSTIRMKKIYEGEWKEMLAGSSIQMWFQIDDDETAEHIEKQFGQVQLSMFADSTNFSDTEGWSENEGLSEAVGKSEAHAKGLTEGTSESESVSNTRTHNMSLSISNVDTWNKSRAEGDSVTEGKSNARGVTENSSWQKSSTSSRGGSEGQSYNEGVSENESHQRNGIGLLDPWIKSTNSGRGTSKNAGKNVGKNWNQSQTSGNGGSISVSGTQTDNTSKTKSTTNTDGVGGSTGKTEQEGYSDANTTGRTTGRTSSLSNTYTSTQSFTTTRNIGRSRSGGRSVGGGTQESFHTRPLITIDEMNLVLASVEEGKDHPEYPGFALIRLKRERPFLVRRSHYDQDPAFEGLFTPHYGHDFVPASQQRLLGGQYTDEHFLPIRLPKPILEAAFAVDVDLLKITDEWFEKGDPLFTYFAPLASVNKKWFKKASQEYEYEEKDLDTEKPFKIKKTTLEERAKIPPHKSLVTIKAPDIGKVIDYAENPAFKEDGDILLIRLERPIRDNERGALEKAFFFGVLDFLKAKGVAQDELNRLRKEINLRYENEWKNYKEEQEQKTLREERQRAEHRRGYKKRLISDEAYEHREYWKRVFVLFVVLLPSVFFIGSIAGYIFIPDIIAGFENASTMVVTVFILSGLLSLPMVIKGINRDCIHPENAGLDKQSELAGEGIEEWWQEAYQYLGLGKICLLALLFLVLFGVYDHLVT